METTERSRLPQDALEAKLKGLLMFQKWAGRWAKLRTFSLRIDDSEATSEMRKPQLVNKIHLQCRRPRFNP